MTGRITVEFVIPGEKKTFTDTNGQPVTVEILYRNGEFIVFGSEVEGYNVTHEPTFAIAIPNFKHHPLFNHYDTAEEWCDLLAPLTDLVRMVDGKIKLNHAHREYLKTSWQNLIQSKGGIYNL